MSNSGIGSTFVLIVSLIYSESFWNSSSPTIVLSSLTPNNSLPPFEFANADTDFNHDFGLFFSNFSFLSYRFVSPRKDSNFSLSFIIYPQYF